MLEQWIEALLRHTQSKGELLWLGIRHKVRDRDKVRDKDSLVQIPIQGMEDRRTLTLMALPLHKIPMAPRLRRARTALLLNMVLRLTSTVATVIPLPTNHHSHYAKPSLNYLTSP